jgi:predicted metalloprotease with PDZ domain
VSSTAPVDVTLVLTPACETAANEPSALIVALSVPAAGRPVFRLDDDVMGTTGVSALITDATAKDARGPLSLVRRLRDRVLELAPSRAASGTVTLEYRARSVSAAEQGAVEGLRHDVTGIGGHGRHFLVLPERRQRYRMRISWGAPRCPATTRGEGMSTFGGAAPTDTAGELSSLREAVYYWGHPQQASFDDGSLHLRVAWFGKPAFDVAAASAWAAKVFAAERAFFADDDPSPYSVFVRLLQSHEDRANGIGQESSYLSWIGPRTTFARRLKVNIAHEMLHRWLGLRLRLRGPEGTAYWFSEGFTVHYSNVIAFRAGLLSVDELLESLNDIATRHFDNKHAGATNDAIRRGFHRDPALSIVPYTRGALYAAELDAALRRASHGKRTLDDALRDLYRESRPGGGRTGLPADAVRRLVQAELGRTGVARYDAVIVRGRHPDPPTDAYGPCFTRKPRKPSGFEWVRVAGVADAQCRAW